MSTESRPEWFERLMSLWSGKVNHAFCLHFNVHDFIPETKEEVRIGEWLNRQLVESFSLVIYFDIARGLTVYSKGLNDPKTKERAMQEINSKGQAWAKSAKVGFPDCKSTEEYMKLIEQGLSTSDEPVAVILGYADAMFSDNPNQTEEQQRNTIRLIQWARSGAFEKHMIVIMVNNSAKLATNLRSSASEFEFIRIPLPKTEEREAFIAGVKLCDGSASVRDLAEHTSGLSLADIRDIIKLSCAQSQPLTVDIIWQKKREILENATAGMLKVVRPRWTPDCLGGLKEARAAFEPLLVAVRSGNVLSVPQGVLVMGPPGTGKSAWAEILAGLLGYTMVELGNIKDMWVGSSEARQSYAYEYIENMAPVVVVRDEFDQSNLKRNEIQGLDAGVSEAMRAKDMQFMARQDLRGKVIWVCISNLPGLIDTAYMRPGRLDLRIPFLPPLSDAERVEIYKAILTKMKKVDPTFKHTITENEFVAIAAKSMIPQPDRLKLDTGIPHEFQNAIDSLTGAEIELICLRAWQMGGQDGTLDAADVLATLDDFIPDRPPQYIDMFLQTIRFTNFRSLLPEPYRELIGNHH